VILVGEMRDLETIDAALTAAETGHLVFSTLHTADAESSVSRVISSFPSGRQDESRSRLASSLRAVVCQMLLPRVDREAACGVVAEIVIGDRATAALIRDGKSHQLRSHIETGSKVGMQTFDEGLAMAVAAGWLDPSLGRSNSRDQLSYTAHLARHTA
jgi:twitching motility protein PilT